VTGSALTLEEAARRLGRARWLEASLFEIIGGWAASEADPATRCYFDACSGHHAWRASQLSELIPELAHLGGVDGLFAPPHPARAGVFGRLRTLGPESGRLCAYVQGVLPAVVEDYEAWLGECSPVSDRPVMRILRFVISDTGQDLREGVREMQRAVTVDGGVGGPATLLAEFARCGPVFRAERPASGER
jgi:hypothetical protein